MYKINVSLSITLLLFSCTTEKEQKTMKPNIIYILADDLGYGDLSCYGQVKFETPNIDNLAEKGMLFTQHYSGSTVCAPSRSTLMTGLHSGHTPIRGNKELKDAEGQNPIPGHYQTIAEMLKAAGYNTGAFGKWGLGFPGSEGDPNMQGFDEFFGYNCQRMAHRYYPPYLWHNQEKVFLEGNDWTNTTTYAPDKIQEAALQFIEDNKDTSFFAYIPLIQPHAELIVPDDSILHKFLGNFEETPFIPLDPIAADYGPNMNPSKYCSQETPYAVFASMITRVDVYVGQIMKKLEELGIADNTIIMFASDNGPHVEAGANPDFFNSTGGLRGVKRDFYEGGIRSPFIVVWPNNIEPGTKSDHISAFWDVYPTFAEIAGTDLQAETDGISFLPELMGMETQQTHSYLYWEINIRGGRKAVRKDQWKAVQYNILKHPKGKIELYNLEEDPYETRDLAEEHPDILAEMEKIMQEARTESELFPLK